MNKKAFSLIELSVVILVIGILVIGITQGSRILKEAKLKSARSLTASSPVVSMSNLVLWLDATDDSKIATGTVASSTYGVVDSGLSVVKWRDRNPQLLLGAQKELTASADGNRPTYVKNGINGLPTLQFDGSTDYLINSATTGVIAGAKTGYTVAAVWRGNTRTTYIIFGQTGASAACGGTYSGMTTNNTALRSWSCGGSYDFGTLAFAAKTDYVAVIKVNKSLNQVSAYLNSASQTGSPSLTANIEAGGISVGGRLDGGSAFFNGYISEIIVFDRALTNAEIDGVQEYLAQKYNIKV
jgi:prepilin-type N-terminal cleavage/methylation domain-containing protein